MFAIVIATCLPIIYATRSTGYYDDTIPHVTNAIRSPSSITSAFSSAFTPDSQPGIPATEFSLPSFTLLIWVLNKFELLGNMSLNLIAACLLATLAVLIRPFLQLGGAPPLLSVPVALLLSLNPINSEFTYFFVSIQHLWTVILLFVLALCSLRILSIDPRLHQSKLLIYSLGATLLGGVAAISSREFFSICAVLIACYLILWRPAQAYPLVAVAWLTAVPYQVFRSLTSGGGSRFSSTSILQVSLELVPASWQGLLSSLAFPLWLFSVLGGILAQILTFQRLTPEGKSTSLVGLPRTLSPAARWYPFILGLLLTSSNSLRTLIIASIPGSNYSLTIKLDDQFSRWLVVEPKSLVVNLTLLGIFAYLTLRITALAEQTFVLATLGCIAVYLSSPGKTIESEVLVRYAIYLVPLILIIVARLYRDHINSRLKHLFIASCLWLLLGFQIPHFVETSKNIIPSRSTAVQLVASGCQYEDPTLDRQSTQEVLRLRATSLSNDQWMSKDIVRDLKRLSRSPRLSLVCKYGEAASTGNWQTILDFMGAYVSGEEQYKLDSVRQSILNRSTPLLRIQDAVREQERHFFGLRTH